VVLLPHPLAGLSHETIAGAVAGIAESVDGWLLTGEAAPPQAAGQRDGFGGSAASAGVTLPPADTVSVSGGDVEAYEAFLARGWTDGLPIVAPTRERVAAMLAGAGLDAGACLGTVPPSLAAASAEVVAANAVMAGCTPGLFPVVVAALQAMLEPVFNLRGVQATTHVAAPLVVVSGPAAQRLGFNAGHNLFGPASRANATVGRALRLALINIGGAVPGVLDKSTLGHPGKYTFCIAERGDEHNPWPPLRTELGFADSDSVVTVFAGEAPHSVSNHSGTARGIVHAIADSLATLGSSILHRPGQALVVISPEHARTIADEGWSRRDIREYLFLHARRPLRDLLRVEATPEGGLGPGPSQPRWLDLDDPASSLGVVRDPEDFILVVAGGEAGAFSACLPGWADRTRAVSRRIPG
jgi:hypothetical protein